MFRLAIVVLAVVGLVSLFSGGGSGAATGVGFLFLLPLLLLAKVLFFFMLFGFIGRGFMRRGPAGEEPPWTRRRRTEGKSGGRRPQEDSFEEWHRMAHAREEVDSWLEDVD
jgi:hypothetical protein